MTERFKFSVAYEEATLQSAVRAYVWKSQMGGGGWIKMTVAFAFIVAIAFLLLAYEFNLLVGLIGGGVMAAILCLATWASIVSSARHAELAMRSEPRAEFLIHDDAVEVTTDRGSGRIAWRSIREIWKFKRVWLLMMDRNRFVTLPLAGVPGEALQFIEAKAAQGQL